MVANSLAVEGRSEGVIKVVVEDSDTWLGPGCAGDVFVVIGEVTPLRTVVVVSLGSSLVGGMSRVVEVVEVEVFGFCRFCVVVVVICGTSVVLTTTLVVVVSSHVVVVSSGTVNGGTVSVVEVSGGTVVVTTDDEVVDVGTMLVVVGAAVVEVVVPWGHDVTPIRSFS